MGTRINVLLDHHLSDFHDREAVLVRLDPALASAVAVRDYGLLADPDYKHDDLKTWRADPLSPVDTNRPRYTAPGSLFLTITNQAAKIHTGGRWRGFLTLEPLRRVHLAAFRQIAGALGRTA